VEDNARPVTCAARCCLRSCATMRCFSVAASSTAAGASNERKAVEEERGDRRAAVDEAAEVRARAGLDCADVTRDAASEWYRCCCRCLSADATEDAADDTDEGVEKMEEPPPEDGEPRAPAAAKERAGVE
jgi:hypothetical protein